jgi:hypothetical protein
VGAPPPSPPPYHAPPAYTGAPSFAGVVSPGLKWGVGIASVLVPLVGFIMGIIYMVDANLEKKAAGKLWLILACAGMAMYCFFGMLGNMRL